MPKCEFRVLVCGGRDYDNRERLFGVLDKALRAATLAERSFALVHGNARGADKLSHEWAAARQVDDVRVYPADWDKHKKAAGPIRNNLMLTSESPDVIIAFKGGNGTAHMMSIGRKAGVPVVEIE